MKTFFGHMDGSTMPGLVGAFNAFWALYLSYWFKRMKATHALDFGGYTVRLRRWLFVVASDVTRRCVNARLSFTSTKPLAALWCSSWR
jgi:hypothetical protein